MATKMLDEGIQKQVKDVLGEMSYPIRILFFGRKTGCDYCPETIQLLTEVAELSDKIKVSSYDLESDAGIAAKYHVTQAPTIVMAGQEGDEVIDYGIRFLGMPSGHEFTSLINDIVMVSQRDSGLSPQTREFLAGLKEPVTLQVFVTPTCPYCPRAVILAHQMALESPWVQAEMVEAMEFPDLADRFDVSGVPQTTINDGAANVVGAAPESTLLKEIQQALGIHVN